VFSPAEYQATYVVFGSECLSACFLEEKAEQLIVSVLGSDVQEVVALWILGVHKLPIHHDEYLQVEEEVVLHSEHDLLPLFWLASSIILLRKFPLDLVGDLSPLDGLEDPIAIR
jgi:hypothetical protein